MTLKFQLDRFTLTPVRVCGKGYSKTDRQSHTDGLYKTTFLDVLKVVPHYWDFAGSFVLGSQRDTGVCPVAYIFDRLAVLYNRLMRLLIFTGVPQNECRFSDSS